MAAPARRCEQLARFRLVLGASMQEVPDVLPAPRVQFLRRLAGDMNQPACAMQSAWPSQLVYVRRAEAEMLYSRPAVARIVTEL